MLNVFIANIQIIFNLVGRKESTTGRIVLTVSILYFEKKAAFDIRKWKKTINYEMKIN